MSMLRRALENEDVNGSQEEVGIVMKGPLSDIYTEALNQVYAKNTAEDGEQPGMESQAQDAMIMMELAKKVNSPEVAPTDSFQTVYGVSRDNVDESTVVDITKELAERNENTEFILIIDQTSPDIKTGDSPERYEALSSALECMVTSHGGKVFSSLQAFAKSR